VGRRCSAGRQSTGGSTRMARAEVARGRERDLDALHRVIKKKYASIEKGFVGGPQR